MNLAVRPFNDLLDGWRPPEVANIPSLIKWTGSKRSQARTILGIMPPHRRYFEPFLGGGALLYAAATPSSVAGDIYEPLIGLWRLIQSEPDLVARNYREHWAKLTEELDGIDLGKLRPGQTVPRYFYEIRERFNLTQDPLALNFIMRTCVNGIVRFNDKGAFNNSFHLSRRGMVPSRFEKIVFSWWRAIQGVEFVCQDYEQTISRCAEGDFVYFDPPYAGNKQRYADDLDLNRFFSALEKLNEKGIKWALSFDGWRGAKNLVHDVPRALYKRHMFVSSGLSAVNKVLNGPTEAVEESLYLNY